jgi:3-oxoacyl-[acyl-carrier-protein] synthase II
MLDAVVTGACRLECGSDPFHAILRLRSTRLRRMDRLCALALAAADGALVDAAIDEAALDALGRPRLAVVLGTRFGCHATNEEYYRGLLAEGPRGASPRLFAFTLPSSPLGEVAIHVRAQGPAQALASGRQAGIEALARAASLCAGRRADLVVAVVAEVGGGALVGGDCADGAAALVIESAAGARAAGRAARARLLGSGLAFVADRAEVAAAAATAHALTEAGLPPRPLAPLAVAPGAGAVDPVLALLAWLALAPHPGSVALALGVDDAGGAAALLAVAGGS